MHRIVLLLLALLLVPPALAQSLSEIEDLRAQQHFEEADDALAALRDERPEDAAVLYLSAFNYVDLGEEAEGDAQRRYYAQALETARQAVEADADDPYAHLALAVAAGRVALNSDTRTKVELSREVKEHADRAIALAPEMDMPYHVRGRWNYGVSDLNFFERGVVKVVYGGLPDASFEQAARDLERATELGSRVVHHLELGRTYMELGREDEARAQLEQALALPQEDHSDPTYQREARELLGDL